jgi:hypothetical protein
VTKISAMAMIAGMSHRLKGQRTIGREDIWCGMTTPTFQLRTALDHLPGGTITHIGANSPAAAVLADAIAGGTGRYAGVHGSVLTSFTSATSGTLDYVLTP